MYNVSCVLYLLQYLSLFVIVCGWILSGQILYVLAMVGWRETGHWKHGGGFYFHLNKPWPQSPVHGSLECFPGDPVEELNSQLQQYLTVFSTVAL